MKCHRRIVRQILLKFGRVLAGFAWKPCWKIATRPTTISGMSNDYFIAARVSHEMKAQLRSLAHEQQQSESAVIKNLLDSLLGSADASRTFTIAEPAVPRGARFYVRLVVEDQLLLLARAAARRLAPATYLAMLSRAHLRELPPLPREELAALKTVVGQFTSSGAKLLDGTSIIDGALDLDRTTRFIYSTCRGASCGLCTTEFWSFACGQGACGNSPTLRTTRHRVGVERCGCAAGGAGASQPRCLATNT